MSMLDHALALAARGFRVFPLISGGKKPAIDAWPIAATDDTAAIYEWFGSQWSNYNIGVCTTGLVVIDVDTKVGPQALANYQALDGHFDTFVVQTATGGYHCYFSGPDSKLAVGLVPGIDVRSHHGYVVGPGSVTSAQHEGCVDGVYTVVNDKPLAAVPFAIQALLKPPIQVARTNDFERDKATSIAFATTWLQAAEPAVQGLSGDNTTYRVAAKLVRDFALSEGTAYQLMQAHWNWRCIPPWEPHELLRKVENAENYGKGDLGAKLPEKTFGQVAVTPPDQQQAQLLQAGGVTMGNAPDPTMILPRPWRVERLLMNGEVSILGGMGAAGKSILQLVLAAHFALGKDFGPFTLKIPGMPLRTIIYNAEDDRMEQARRLYAVCLQYNLDYFAVRQNLALADDRAGEIIIAVATRDNLQPFENGINFIKNTAMNERADLLFFDPAVNLHRCNENDNSHMTFFMRQLRSVARETNTAVMVADHTGKGTANKEKGDADVLRGAGAKINSAHGAALIISGLTKQDGTDLRIQDISHFSRLDNAKSNNFRKTGKALAWLEWKSQHTPGGDQIGVPVLFDTKLHKALGDQELGVVVRDYLVQQGGAVGQTAVAKHIINTVPLYRAMTEGTVRSILQTTFANAVAVGTDNVVMVVKANEKLLKLV